MRLRIASLATACALALQGVAFAAPAPEDSVTETVAVFLASNLRQGIEQAVSQLQSYGIDVDRERLESLLLANLARPYDRERHVAASQAVADMMARSAARRSEQLLAQAAMQPASVTLPSGVVITVNRDGTGATPSENSTITMRYMGLLPDGTVFDEITADAEPMRARVSDLAPGMAEALTNIRAGGRYTVTIPSSLAYGSEGVPGVIPPDSALQFIIELISTD